MAKYLLKKSYQLKDLKQIEFNDLWGDHGIFTTMWIFGKPAKILFFNNHLRNLILSLKKYQIKKKSLKEDILKIININLSKKKKYNHLLRIAVNKKIISISLRKRVKSKSNFNLKLAKIKREKPQFKNLKYKKILSYLSKMDNSQSDIALVSNKKILETGTSNLLFVKDKKFFTPKKDYYQGNTYKFFKSKIKKIIKKDILLKEIKNYDEILLLGSGKGVTSVKSINEIKWKRKSQKKFNFLSKQYDLVIKNCNFYRF
ncbi:aminotransferase class IV [Candidatus Pelagibacter communis]|uniref:aminotransferase class IV n=1 Tax=Pelagibacter ubique TaxID=198252 RepID=UPI00094D1DD7|nr:aminotransferase class IV [Candidatus Pelagibacter ubique]